MTEGKTRAARRPGGAAAERLGGLEFLRVMGKGEKHSCPVCVAYFMPAKEFKSGIAVSKKLGSAVVRNRIKRVLREAVRLTKKDLVQPCHMVLVARAGAERLSMQQARSLLLRFCAQARVVEAVRE